MTGSLTPQDFDDWHRKNLEEEIAAHPEGYVVGCLFDIFFPDNKQTECSKCGVPLYLRAWLLEAAQKYKLPIVCQFCVDPKDFRSRLLMDFAKVEEEFEKH